MENKREHVKGPRNGEEDNRIYDIRKPMNEKRRMRYELQELFVCRENSEIKLEMGKELD